MNCSVLQDNQKFESLLSGKKNKQNISKCLLKILQRVLNINMDLNLSREAENLLLSQFDEQEEKDDMYSEVLNFGDREENLALA